MEDSANPLEALEEYIDHNDDGSVTLHLEYPVQVKNGKDVEEVEKLTFRRSKGADWMATDSVKGDITKTTKLASLLCDRPMSALKAMDGADYARMLQIVNNMGNLPQIGGTA